MNSLIRLLLFTVVAAVLFASSDPMVAAAPAGEQAPPVPSKGDEGKGKEKLSFLDLLPGKNDNKFVGKDVVDNFGSELKGSLSGLMALFSGVKIPKIST